MGKINVLDENISELIAAGEVIERPSSVIKELVENSIDSGASNITVEIRNGGTTFMKVTDDGSGIDRDDVRKAFLRHATSKVSSKDDLEKISTLGFRGEALASITAVSRVEVYTRIKDDLEGTHFKISASKEELFEEAGCAKGTTIIVEDLFYNVPVRMKFLKKDVSEANAVASLIDRIALSHPEISFKFIRDGKETLNTPGNKDIKSTIYAVYGKEFSNSMIPLDYKLAGVKISGFISLPNSSRPNRRMQHFFVNGRYVKSNTAMSALEQAYKGSIMVGKFPSCVMYINLPCEVTDVNVHPAKLEIRFIDERPVFNAVYHGVKSSINNNERLKNFSFDDIIDNQEVKAVHKDVQVETYENKEALKTEIPLKKNIRSISLDEDDMPDIYIPPKPRLSLVDMFNVKGIQDEKDEPMYAAKTIPMDTDNNLKSLDEVSIDTKAEEDIEVSYKDDDVKIIDEPILKEEEQNYKFIGEAFSTYIILENNDEIILIDKHAAHERLIYEKLKKENRNITAQMLLSPMTLNLDKDEYAAIVKNLDILMDAGFDIEDFGLGTVILRSAPTYLEKGDIKSSIIEIAEHILQNKSDLNTEYLDWIYHNIACRAAIKAGERQEKQELIELVKDLNKNPNLKHCPHGRPIYISITKKDIEKQFGRMG